MERRCIYCGQLKPKSGLIRVARLSNGEFEVDLDLSKRGRGAYICKTMECLAGIKKKRSLDRSFRTNVGTDIYSELEASLTEYPKPPAMLGGME